MALRRKITITAALSAAALSTLLTQDLPTKYDAASDEARLVAQIAPSSQTALNDASAPNLAKADSTPASATVADSGNTTVATVTAVPKPTPSQNVTINLIHRLVERGVLTQADADELIKQAEDDAVRARALAAQQLQQQHAAMAREEEAAPQLFQEPSSLSQNLTSATTSATPAPPTSPPNETMEEETAVDVNYIPETVKQQLREEIKEEVMQQARDENWASPRSFPAWGLRVTPFLDFRGRYEGDFYPSGSDTTGAFPNFNAINTGPPFDVTGTTFSPQLNTNADRERFRLRLRAGVQVDFGDGFTGGVRLATGETDTPVSPNQSLGVSNNAQGGNFSKYALWLDRAFVRYEVGGLPNEDFQVNLGRFDNPFFTTTGIIWYEDLGFDGLAISGRHQAAKGFTPFFVAGGFPIFNTDLNFATNRPDKFSSEDKYLLSAQAGFDLRLNKDFSVKVAGAYYDFYNVEGKLSDPFVPLTASDQGSTDDSRPSFAQYGNTYFPIRRIIPTADNGFGTNKQFQYFGLATPFRVANFTGKLDYSHFDPIHMQVYGEWLENTAFDWNDINSKAINNRGANLPNGNPGRFAGGNTGWIAGIKIGAPVLQKRWDWNVGVNYRYVESDATVDGFVDSDFAVNFAGTNLKGYTIFGSLALTSNTWFFIRFMSANSVAGPSWSNDVLQVDFNAKF